MKKIVYICIAALGLLACNKHEDEVSRITSNPYDASVTGTCVRGDAHLWQVADTANLSLSQMQVTVDQYGVPAAMSEDDSLAAFVGNECRGVVGAFQNASGKWRFNLTVHATTTDPLSNMEFTLRYYSARESGVYTSQPIPYIDDDFLGSPSCGYVPKWK